MLARLSTSIVVLLLSVVAGCACSDRSNSVCPYVSPTSEIDCDVVDPQPFVPDLSLVDQIPPLPAIQYCNLPENEVQCTAAMHSAVANLLVQEATAVEQSTPAQKFHYANTSTSVELMLLLADHQRNEDAANAMELFYRLVEAEAGDQTLAKQIEEFEAGLRSVQELEQRNMLSPVSRAEITSQQLAAEHRRIDLRTDIDTLNAQLASLLKVDLPAQSRFWPAANLTVEPQIPSAEESVAIAMGNRADLAALRLAAGLGPRDSLVASQLILPAVQAGLGRSSSLAKLAVLHRNAQNSEGETRNVQLSMVLAEREKNVREETLRAVSLIHARLQQIDLTRQRISQLGQRVESLTKQRELTPTVQIDLDKAEIDLLTAEQALIHDIVQWKIAGIRLKQSQGLLGRECGYDRANCDW